MAPYPTDKRTLAMIERAKDAFCRKFKSDRAQLITRMESPSVVKVIEPYIFSWADYELGGQHVYRCKMFDARDTTTTQEATP